MIAELHTDGGARPSNPGYAGLAVVVDFQPTGLQTHGKRHVLSRYLGRRRTNNYAEFAAFYVGVKWAHHLGVKNLYAYADSKLLVGAMVHDHKMRDELKVITKLTRDFLDKNFDGHWSLTHIPRADNSVADAFCTSAIHWGMAQNPWFPGKVRDKLKLADGRVYDPFAKSGDSSPYTDRNTMSINKEDIEK
jgi:ribonuclease HI